MVKHLTRLVNLMLIIIFSQIIIINFAIADNTLNIGLTANLNNKSNSTIPDNTQSQKSKVMDTTISRINQVDLNIIKAFAHDNNYKIKVMVLHNNKDNFTIPNNIDIATTFMALSSPIKTDSLAISSLPITKITPAAIIRCQDINYYATYSQIKKTKAKIAFDDSLPINNSEIIFKKAKITHLNNISEGIKQLLNYKQSIIITNSINANFEHLNNPKLCSVKLKTDDFINGYSIFLFHNNSVGKDLQQSFNKWWLLNKGKYLENQ